jgi:hypothetical protein
MFYVTEIIFLMKWIIFMGKGNFFQKMMKILSKIGITKIGLLLDVNG